MAPVSASRDSANKDGLRLVLQAPAKLNLSLVVLGRRPDGYHDLHTVMAAITLCDELELSLDAAEGVRLRCGGLGSPEGPENLVHRAATLFRERTKLAAGVSIDLTKRIPAGAGLGGGSSDAAACLWGLNALTGNGLGRTALAEMAAALGSDVPFFLYGPTAVCTGRGEIVSPIRAELETAALLVLPKMPVATAAVYGAYRHDAAAAAGDLATVQRHLAAHDLAGLAQRRINHLTGPCMALTPALARLRDEIEARGIGPLSLSGSGSSLFALAERAEAEAWAAQLAGDRQAEAVVVDFVGEQTYFAEVRHADHGD